MLKVWHVLCVVFVLSSAWDYCEDHWCSRPNDHVACNNNGTLGPDCQREAKLMPLSSQLQRFIVHQVNFYRNQVASGRFEGLGPAHRMATVRWDPELAQLAELAAKRCSLSADTCRNTRRFKHVGQLTGHVIFSAGRHTDTKLLGHKIANWFGQYKRATSQLGAADPISDITSFRQLMQERATHMGCGVVRQRRLHRWHQQFIVCNFARENVAHEPAYEIGSKAAQGCRSGPNPRYPNLCSPDEHYDVNAVDRFHKKTTRLSLKTRLLYKYSEPNVINSAKENSIF